MNFANLLFDNVIIVEQPFGRRRNGAALADRGCGGAIRFEQDGRIVPQPGDERSAGYRYRGVLGCCEALGMLFETLDTEELLADGFFVIPGRI
jgi:hypothetical protein